jgi:hypothetical protein
MGLESVVMGDRRWITDVSGAFRRNCLQEVTGAILPASMAFNTQLFSLNPLEAHRSFYASNTPALLLAPKIFSPYLQNSKFLILYSYGFDESRN